MDTNEHRLEKILRACLKMMKHVAMAITFAIAYYLVTVFSHPDAWFMRAAETISPSPGGEGRGEGGLQTIIELHFKIFKQALVFYPCSSMSIRG
ncbi:MAG: hypothetical protein ABSF34_08455 [Verrucomicrobiota bacterium]